MRIENPLILGAGPAGCAAAICLARTGETPLLLDRDEHVGDPLCGGFLSWRTAQQLGDLGIDLEQTGAHRVSQLRLFHEDRHVELPLPHPAYGLSRHALDTVMRAKAIEAGAQLEFDTIRGLDPGVAHGQSQDWRSDAIFLATGKHDVRGQSRPRDDKDTALGLRLRLPASAQRTGLLEDAIELHLFDGGYVGIVLQEGGSANICLAVRKSALASHGGSPETLFAELAEQIPALAGRLGDDWHDANTDTIGAVPYGWICRETQPGLYRLGDQAAVIPSLAGEGISIAIASGVAAANAHAAGKGAERYQQDFARRAARPVGLARMGWHLAETRLGARGALALARIAPRLIAQFADWARIQAPPPLAR
ncbi:NAD(P)/FAD-dependent oxidoreductase [Aurantiacibacter sp. MUD61]|uniref:NAD(P)/FAD-dependent oxidoreductase n=1 Tax=Aurantiacibacter sp. MUD61 TaxID=3009083 RepID=UPI0022F141E8|nr:FAD-dependent monooxygenase [Aurantiacibacter sp. MUD61]